MGFDLRYNFINTFRTVDAWRNNILLNAQGGLLPGFKQRRTHLGMQQASFNFDPGTAGSASLGGTAPKQMMAGELVIQRTALMHRQDPLKHADGNFSHLAIEGNGFFVVAESLNPGSRVMLTRDGSFYWKEYKDDKGQSRYHLVNGQGLYVLRAQDVNQDSWTVATFPPQGQDAHLPSEKRGPAGILGHRDGNSFLDPLTGKFTDPSSQPLKGISTWSRWNSTDSEETQKKHPENSTSFLAIMQVPNQADLNISSFGPNIYNLSMSTMRGATIRPVSEWEELARTALFRGDIPNVQGNRIEQADAQVALQLATLENQTADYVFKNLSTMLQEYNNSQDQLLNLIK